MTTVMHYFWVHTDDWGRRRRTNYKLSEAEARDRLRDPERVEWSAETINIPDDPMGLMGGGIRTEPPDRD